MGKNNGKICYFTDSLSKAVFKLSWSSAGNDSYTGHLSRVLAGRTEIYDFNSSGWDLDLDIPLDAANQMEKWLREFHGEGAPPMLAEIVKSQARSLDTMQVVEGISGVRDYGAALGLEITYKGKQFRLRPKPDEFLSPKPFQIWLLSEFGEYFWVPEKSEVWTTFMTIVSRLADKAPAFSDDLAPPVLDELLRSIQRNDILMEFTEDSFVDMEKSGVRHFFVIEDVMYLHSRVYSDIMEQYELSRRKMRQFFEPYLIERSTKQVHQFGLHPRFWLLDWRKMGRDFPEIRELIEPKEYDRMCSECGDTIQGSSAEQENFMREHCEKHGISYPVYEGPADRDKADEWLAVIWEPFLDSKFPSMNVMMKANLESPFKAGGANE